MEWKRKSQYQSGYLHTNIYRQVSCSNQAAAEAFWSGGGKRNHWEPVTKSTCVLAKSAVNSVAFKAFERTQVNQPESGQHSSTASQAEQTNELQFWFGFVFSLFLQWSVQPTDAGPAMDTRGLWTVAITAEMW